MIAVTNPTLRVLLTVVFTLFALLGVNALYLGTITLLEWSNGKVYQDYFYQLNMLFHLGAGLLLILPFVGFGFAHMRRALQRPNRRAIRIGIALFSTGALLILSGIILTRFDFFEVKDPLLRTISYWLHVITPVAVIILYIVHRQAGKGILWHLGKRWAAVAFSFAGIMLVVHLLQRPSDPVQNAEAQPYAPSFARTVSGDTIPAEKLMMDTYCADCHADAHTSWKKSAHHLSSFNNPAYLASVTETKDVLQQRDGTSEGIRFCAACHDPVPLFSGKLEQPGFDMKTDPTGKAGLTCSACHAIDAIGSTRGNGDYTIADPQHYPFTFSDNESLRWLNRQLVKAKPAFHKKTFLKPLHKTAEFCSVCHKVSIPESFNAYRWLRGQNHYDSFLLSGVSGHGVASFYYPQTAVKNCAQCHMPLELSKDFGSRNFDGSGELTAHNHQFAAANTAIPILTGLPEETIEAHRDFLANSLRLDIFGIREAGEIDGELMAPLRPALATLEPGKSYLIEIVLRTLKPGHTFTQGTADSNQVWLDVTAVHGGKTIGRSGSMEKDGKVDPWSHFVNSYVLDRNGERIDRRNVQDIVTSLYNNQIPPGAADVVHYLLRVPDDATGSINISAVLNYRKFDTSFLRYFMQDPDAKNLLPVTSIASDEIILQVAGSAMTDSNKPVIIEQWQRWNDYGIGLLRKQRGLQLRQAESAFINVEQLGRPEGAINLARVYLKEGRLNEAADALRRAAEHEISVAPWTITWFTGLINKQNGKLDAAIGNFKMILNNGFPEATARGFDFSLDYRVINELGQTLFDRAKQVRGENNKEARNRMLREAVNWFDKTLAIDVENLEAHYNLSLIHNYLGETQASEHHRVLHNRYRIDDNASDRVITLHRSKYPAADHAAEAVVIYDLKRQTDN